MKNKKPSAYELQKSQLCSKKAEKVYYLILGTVKSEGSLEIFTI